MGFVLMFDFFYLFDSFFFIFWGNVCNCCTFAVTPITYICSLCAADTPHNLFGAAEKQLRSM